MSSLQVSGIIYISTPVEEHASKYSTYFHFTGVGKDPYYQPQNGVDKEKGRKYYKVQVRVPTDKIESARKMLKEKTMLQIRIGELESYKFPDSGNSINTVLTKWEWIEQLNALPRPERQD